MILTIAVFFFGIILAASMIVRKIWQFHTLRVVPGTYEAADWTDLSIMSIRERLIEITKFGIHHFVLFMLKMWIKLSNWIRVTDRKIKVRLMHFLHRNGHLPSGGTPSPFLTAMHAHKDEVTSAMEKESSAEEV